MNLQLAKLVLPLAMIANYGVHIEFVQQTSAQRNFEAEIQASAESAKTSAGFEHLGTFGANVSVAAEKK